MAGQPDGELAPGQQGDDGDDVAGFAQSPYHFVGGHNDGQGDDGHPEARRENQRDHKHTADSGPYRDGGAQVASGPRRRLGRLLGRFLGGGRRIVGRVACAGFWSSHWPG